MTFRFLPPAEAERGRNLNTGLAVFGDSGYVVLYRYHKQTAVILAVRHQRETGY